MGSAGSIVPFTEERRVTRCAPAIMTFRPIVAVRYLTSRSELYHYATDHQETDQETGCYRTVGVRAGPLVERQSGMGRQRVHQFASLA